MSDVMIARQGARVVVGGVTVPVYMNRTTAHVDSQVVRDYPDIWVPLPVDFPADVEQPGAGQAPGDGPERPGDRDGRGVWDAYAVALGLDAEAVAAMARKADVVTVADGLAAGRLVLGEDGQLIDVSTPGG